MSDEPKLTRAEWERERSSELATKTAGDLASKVAALEYDLKIKRDELTATQSKLPPEGSVLLSKADAERWNLYQQLGKPDELKDALAQRDTLTANLAQRERKDAIRTAAEIAGYKASVLERLAPDGVTFDVKATKDAEGKENKAAYIKQEDGTEVLLSEYVNANFPDFLPALSATTNPTATTPTPFPTQAARTEKPQPMTDAQFLAKKQAESDLSI